ncbi:hypothetical protein [Klebsiella pneumoniae]|uniref:hypothetical protein n=1 Tax=Klebsiella pneumoniae TaxID=573 RepID=UPI000E2DF0A0|nr:hypothetical protein [Klebsiella pneumoniae]MEA4778101.1 hypothetical protein [Klebsiella pneumoniae]RLK95616.1 hypothetical protein D9K88_24520 [Klebsiella pneumoniae]WFA35132.1 hypothetical protein LVQ71_24050 [Klebsiella pneumoniae]SYR47713.1 Uncharacterised protein [Klebsiella pneumoniae]HBR7278584.1 hypothetical protein [Klebsiella pneumoniae]
MHNTLIAIQARLRELISQVQASVPNDEPFGNAHANWTYPGLTRAELIEEAETIVGLIEKRCGEDLGEHEARLQDYVRRLQHLQQHTVPQLWGNAGQAVPVYMLTLQGLRKALDPVLNRDDRAEAASKLKRLTQQLRGMEARLNGLEPRATELNTMVERIEQAYHAADQLPTDLETLAEARQNISDLIKDATRDQGDVQRIREGAGELDKQLNKIADDAEAVLERCETAYSAATSVGLAAAFSERSSTLSKSMWVWVAGLVGALAAGSYFGSAQLHSLAELFKAPNVATSVVLLNLLLSVLSVGAPVWFAWLSTKQIGQRFRLAEDYAFKASISRAYEGFRREAARFDKDMEARLLTSALTRLDELPLRLVETDSHGSPWHELASSNEVKQAMQAVPGFSEQIKDLASKALVTVTSLKVPVASISTGEEAQSSGKNKVGDA